MSSAGLWIIGPVIAGSLMFISISVIIFLRCRARRLAEQGLNHNMNVHGTAIAMPAQNIQFKNNPYPNMPMEVTSWGLNNNNNNNNQMFTNQNYSNNYPNNTVANNYPNMGNEGKNPPPYTSGNN